MYRKKMVITLISATVLRRHSFGFPRSRRMAAEERRLGVS